MDLPDIKEFVFMSINVDVYSSSLSYYAKKECTEDTTQNYVYKERIFSLRFASSKLFSILDEILKKCNQKLEGKDIALTGCYSQNDLCKIENILKTKVNVDNYLERMIEGFIFLFKNIRDEIFFVQPNCDKKYIYLSPSYKIFPYLLVSTNGTVDFVKVSSTNEYQVLGHSEFDLNQILIMGLRMTQTKSIYELITLATSSSDFNKLVNCGYESFLKDNKLGVDTLNHHQDINQVNSTVAWNLFWIWCNNLSQLILLYAQNNNIENVVFGTGIINIPEFVDLVNLSLNYWSKSKVKAIFLRHEAFIPSLGALLNHKPFQSIQHSWTENYALSCGYQGKFFDNDEVQKLVVDSLRTTVAVCPLLKYPDLYFPSTQNLYVDDEAREHWVSYCISGLDQSLKVSKNITNFDEQTKWNKYHECICKKLHYVNEHPNSYGNLSLALLLDMLYQCKSELGIYDSFSKIKNDEMNLATKLYMEHINNLDKLDLKERHHKLALYVLAGNMFDWGAKSCVELLYQSGNFSFNEAIAIIPERPWLIDDLDSWTAQMESSSYKLAAVFVDNYGFDLLLGVFPFVRELLKNGTKIIMCVNRDPVVNDATEREVKNLLNGNSLCSVIKDAYVNKNLSIMEIAKSNPTIDFFYLNKDFVDICKDIDLLMIVGMGRAIITNLEAEFNVDNLKIAVIKDQWMSKKMGGKEFSPVFKFTKSTKTKW